MQNTAYMLLYRLSNNNQIDQEDEGGIREGGCKEWNLTRLT